MDTADQDDFPWPKRGVDPFRPDRATSLPALLESGQQAWGFFAAGFRFSAQVLVKRIEATGYEQDFLALPVLYLYRHYAELALKEVIFDAGALLGQRQPVQNEHDLRNLWRMTRELLKRLDLEDADTDAVEELLNVLGAVDPKSMTFRYPVDTSGRVMLPKKLERLDLPHFARQMEGFAGWIDGTTAMLEQTADFYAEHRP
jgi:hypothetical protein